MPSELKLTVQLTYDILFSTLSSLLCSAVESGGISYWASVKRGKKPKYYNNTPEDKDYYYRSYPLNEGGSIIVIDHEEDGKEHTLDLPKIIEGLQVMGSQYPHHLKNILAETEDATTADALVQCAIFGEVIYG